METAKKYQKESKQHVKVSTGSVNKKQKINLDPSLIEKKVMIDTQGKRGKSYGQLAAKITNIENGEYVAFYTYYPDQCYI